MSVLFPAVVLPLAPASGAPELTPALRTLVLPLVLVAVAVPEDAGTSITGALAAALIIGEGIEWGLLLKAVAERAVTTARGAGRGALAAS